MIDEKETFKLFGYYSTQLKPKSTKKIVTRCDTCGRIKIVAKYNYHSYCNSCKQIGDKNNNYHKDFTIETREKMGYNASHRSEETLEKMRVSQLGKKHTITTRKKISDNHVDVSGNKNPSWLGGISFDIYCSLFNEEFKELIRNKHNRQCFLCGMLEKDNDQKLSVHHVNYDKNCLCGTKCEFVPLCKSCHSKTNHNRKYWEELIMYYLYPERYFMVDI